MLLNGGSTVPGVVQCHGFFIPTWSGMSPGALLLDERNVNSFFFSFFLLICSPSVPGAVLSGSVK